MKLLIRGHEEKNRFRLQRRSGSFRGSTEAISAAGKATEKDASRSAGTVEPRRFTPNSPKRQRRTPLGRRLEEIRERIEASGEPLLSWEEIDREVGERRGEIQPEASGSGERRS